MKLKAWNEQTLVINLLLLITLKQSYAVRARVSYIGDGTLIQQLRYTYITWLMCLGENKPIPA